MILSDTGVCRSCGAIITGIVRAELLGGPLDGQIISRLPEFHAVCLRGSMGRWHTWHSMSDGKMVYIGLLAKPSGGVLEERR